MPVETTDGLTRGQRERRTRVIRAALDLAARGGYEAVQMREVAIEAGVALGTIYRYFSSKDHLLVAAMVEWVEDLERTVQGRPPRSSTAAERVLEVLDIALRALDREPKLAAAVVTAQTSTDGAAVRAAEQVTEVMDRLMRAAFPEGIDRDHAAAVARTLGHVWFSCLVSWTSGVGDMAWVRRELEVAVGLMLAVPMPSTTGGGERI